MIQFPSEPQYDVEIESVKTDEERETIQVEVLESNGYLAQLEETPEAERLSLVKQENAQSLELILSCCRKTVTISRPFLLRASLCPKNQISHFSRTRF